MGRTILLALSLAGLAAAAGYQGGDDEAVKPSCCLASGRAEQTAPAKAEKLQCSLTGKVVDSCCCVERQGVTHCTLAQQDVRSCCCKPAGSSK